MNLTPVIMAGGAGTRLWPMSRSLYPKQFLPLVNKTTMLQDTLNRLHGLQLSALTVICGEDHRFIVAEQLRSSTIAGQGTNIILEPAGRNTAPAVALAALQSLADTNGEDALLLVLAADHAIQNIDAFQQAVKTAAKHAATGKLVTFGIVPQAPETGYGYIRQGDAIPSTTGSTAYAVAQFIEKPNRETAELYLQQGNYLWNSGMFLLSAKRYLEELKTHRPDIHQACQQAMASPKRDSDFIRPDRDTFINCPEDSIDYAVMEKTHHAVVVPMDCGWSDVGSWSALWDVAEKDSNGNALYGDVIAEATSNSYIRSDGKLIATVGLDDVIVVESDDAIMVAHKSRVQDVKAVVQKLKAKRRSESELHRKVYRPWGYYDSIDNGDRFQVKRIVVNPGQKLSLQMHHHRAEHWIVVRGTAKVTKGSEEFLVTENQSTYIPLGTTHRLVNPGNIPLEMVEVQSGSYLGEDDIVRFDDVYNRN